jgi:hypothetical protein
MGLDDSRREVLRLLGSSQFDAVFADAQQWNLNGQAIIKQWLDDLKAEEDRETFGGAFTDKRMTIRGIGPTGRDGDTSGDTWKRGRMVPFGTNDKAIAEVTGNVQVSQIKLYKGVDGMKERMKPANFPARLPGDVSPKTKYALGLHDLSATLLTNERAITDQFKYYQTAIWVFMPVPRQEDLVTFHSLNGRAKEVGSCQDYKQYVRMLASRITRIKLAQACDMHTTYIDVAGLNYYSPPKAKSSIRYGLTGSTQVRTPDVDVILHEARHDSDMPKTWAANTLYIIKYKNKEPLTFKVFGPNSGQAKIDKTEGVLRNYIKTGKKEDYDAWEDSLRDLKAFLRQYWPKSKTLNAGEKRDILNEAAPVAGHKVWVDKDVTLDDIKARKNFALEYKSILSSIRNNDGRGANEIVMAYREHGSAPGRSLFPMYAELVRAENKFCLLNDNFARTGATITDNGAYTAG